MEPLDGHSDLAIKALVGALCDPLRAVRHSAAEALAKFGKAALPAVINFAEQADPAVIEPVVWLLCRWHDVSAAPVMRKLLENPLTPSRPQLVQALAQILGAEAQSTILPLTRSPDRSLRIAATRALQQIQSQPSPAMEVKSPASQSPGRVAGVLRSPAPEPAPTATPPVIESDCYFSVLAPESVRKETPFILEVWCDADDPSRSFASRRTLGTQLRSRGPIPVPSGAVLSVTLSIPGFSVAESDGTLLWRGPTC